ncbi:MAG: hypothetical protein BRD38_00785 [Bacteroidetes bacterium QH_9_67_14]|nr:MAG: hypothetical protein BRD38_00785 [Bacteroidetes bacterium QH_9_67_14]
MSNASPSTSSHENRTTANDRTTTDGRASTDGRATAAGRATVAADAVAATSTDGQAAAVSEDGELMEELFEALDDVAGVVVALDDDPEHREKARTLDRAGKRIIDTLVREFSFKSAQVEVLLRELDDVDEAWGTYAQKVARRNERLGEGGVAA